MFTLKTYQTNALSALKDFLTNYKDKIKENCTPSNALEYAFQRAFEQAGFEGKTSYNDIFNGSPSVCLRIPTGGGKTIIAASAIKQIDEGTLETGAPVVLWLTPSDAITVQTYEALKDTKHPYRQSLEKQYPGKVKVCDIDSVETLQPSDFRNYCIVIVSTNQTFNITDTSQRNAYSFNENFEAFFNNLSEVQKSDLEKVTKTDIEDPNNSFFTQKDINRVKFSLANLLKLHHPILIVDEAHNNRTETYFNTLNRLSPSACLELTATPVVGNNTIFSVSAWDLKAANMIKLPILLTANEVGWEICVNEAVKTRNELEKLTKNETAYIRPLVLIQAENKGGSATVEKVKEYLICALNISEKEVAVYTGNQKDFQNSDLFSDKCSIRYIITVKALKEGWDCSFAYVLCGLQDIHSSKDIEQLMGRILRLPYAQRRNDENLNRAYAYLQSEDTQLVALKLQDGFVKKLGFDRLDADDLIQKENSDIELNSQLPLFSGSIEETEQFIPVAQVIISGNPDEIRKEIEAIGLEEKVSIQPVIHSSSNATQEVIISSNCVLNQEDNDHIEKIALNHANEKEKSEIQDRLQGFRYQQSKKRSKRLQQTPFEKLPLLLIVEDGISRELSAEAAFTTVWDPLKYRTNLTNFPPKLSERKFLFDANANKKFQFEQLSDSVDKQTEHEESMFLSNEFEVEPVEFLINWVVNQIKRKDLTQVSLKNFVEKVIVGDLINDKKLPVETLTSFRVPLEKAISNLLERNYEEAKKEGFQGLLDRSILDFTDDKYYFEFLPDMYEPSRVYKVGNGSRDFQKHYFPRIHDLRYKTENGTVTEEYLCALAIDTNPDVEYWIRNVERSKYSFRLPIPTGNFYPDFVVQLKDKRLLVVEYKGEQLKNTEDTKYKILVGNRWEKLSNEKCLFLMAEKEKEGLSVSEQIEQKIHRPTHR